MRWSTAACGASHRPASPHPAPSPFLTSCTPRKVRRAVWRTHSGLPTLVAGGTRRLRRAATARARHAFSPRDTHACPHTASQLHMAHPAPHMTAIETRATPRQPRRPHRAWPAHRGPFVLASTRTRCPRTDQTRRSGLAQHRSERQPAPATVHHKNHSPAPVGQSQCPSTALRRGPSGAADPHLHSELRHALHTAHTRPPETSTAPAPPLPARCTLPQHSTRAYGV